ncbi:MAG: hypothetical protein NTU41_09605 [Chloroflexi bacterium]|nr:hypothetical protein [Chloroflexota bacterium]
MGNDGIPTSILVFILVVLLAAVAFVTVITIVVVTNFLTVAPAS